MPTPIITREDQPSIDKIGHDFSEQLNQKAQQDSAYKLQQLLGSQKQQQLKQQADQEEHQSRVADELTRNNLIDAAGVDKTSPTAYSDAVQSFQKRGSSLAMSPGGHVAMGVDPYVKMQGMLTGQIQKQGVELNKTAGKLYQPIDQQAQLLSTLHDNLDQGSAIGDKQVAAGLARLTEGPGQRLLSSVIDAMSPGKSLSGSITDKANWLKGQSESGFTPEQRNAIRESLFSHQAILQKQLQNTDQQFSNIAPSLAPTLAQQGQLQGMMTNYGMSPRTSLQDLDKRKQTYLQQAGPNAKANQPQMQQYQQPQGMMGNLRNSIADLIRGPSSQQQQAPQQAPSQNAAVPPQMPQGRSQPQGQGQQQSAGQSAPGKGSRTFKVIRNRSTGKQAKLYSDGTLEEIQ